MTRPAGSSRLLRTLNERATLGHLLEHGRLTRGELCGLTGLSKPTASEVLRRLEDAGLVVAVGRASGGPGPNATVYAANPAAAYAVAVSVREVTATARPTLCAALVDLTGENRARLDSSVDFAAQDPAEAVSATVASLCRRARVARKRVLHVRLGVPGAYDESADRVHHIDVPGWSRPGVVDDVRHRLRTNVQVDNDANLAAIAERRFGAVREATGFALLWLGTEGLGLAVDLGDRLLRGNRGGAGEIGYVPVPASGRQRRQDFQDLVGGPAVLELAGKARITADTPDQAVAAAVDSESRAAQRFLRELGERIALGLAAVVAVLDPPVIVLSGEVGRAGGTRLAEAVTAALHSVFSSDTEILSTALGAEDPVLLGAERAAVVAVREQLLGTLAADRPE